MLYFSLQADILILSFHRKNSFNLPRTGGNCRVARSGSGYVSRHSLHADMRRSCIPPSSLQYLRFFESVLLVILENHLCKK